MGLVSFIQGTAAAYKNLASKNADALYFLDNGQIYKGTNLFTNIRLVSELPEKANAVSDSLYIVSSTSTTYYYDGVNFINISKTFVSEITDDTLTTDVPTVGALKAYITSHPGYLTNAGNSVTPIYITNNAPSAVTGISTDLLTNGENELILDGNFLK